MPFPSDKSGAQILVTYEVDESDWKLIISDNGMGKKEGDGPRAHGGGLGTTIVNALAKQLGARVDTETGAAGMKVSITRTAVTPGLLRAA